MTPILETRGLTKRFGGLVRTLDEKHMRREAARSLSALDVPLSSLAMEIEKLSGGQRQAVAIARAWHWNARLMIMDEPTNNLGVAEQARVLEMIRTLRTKGVAVILVSHSMHDIFAVTDRILVMRHGRMVAERRTAGTSREEIVRCMLGLLGEPGGSG